MFQSLIIRSKCILTAAFASCLLGLAPTAHADTIEIASDVINSTEGLGAFTGTIEYHYDDVSDLGELTIALTNTSDSLNGGYITGFLFNIGSADADADAWLTSVTHAFLEADGVSAMPFGNPFDDGATLYGSWQGGMYPLSGIAVGTTGQFGFTVTADDAASLTAASFVPDEPYEYNFVVRFRGFDDDGSDKVPAVIVPLPAPVAMGVFGLGGVLMLRRLNRRA